MTFNNDIIFLFYVYLLYFRETSLFVIEIEYLINLCISCVVFLDYSAFYEVKPDASASVWVCMWVRDFRFYSKRRFPSAQVIVSIVIWNSDAEPLCLCLVLLMNRLLEAKKCVREKNIALKSMAHKRGPNYNSFFSCLWIIV